jgi:cyclase
VLLDIDASKQKRHIDFVTIEDVASECFMPLSVGGGLSCLDDISAVLARGADKVVLNTKAILEPSFISAASAMFGKQCIVVSIDAISDGGNYAVYSHAGAVGKRRPLLDWVRSVQELGAGEILLNSVDRDGKMTGYDLALIEQVAKVTSVPLIVAGGASSTDDGVRAVRAGANAVSMASVFHFTSITPQEVKQVMSNAGIPVRLQ